MLCEVCREVFNRTDIIIPRDSMVLPRTFLHHHSRESLKLAASKGCYICAVIWECWEPDSHATKVILRVEKVWHTPEGAFDMFFDKWSGENSYRVRFTAEVKDKAYEYANERFLRSTASESSMHQAIKWIQECRDNHLNCQPQSNQTMWYPSRLIDIGTSTSGPRLLASNTVALDGPYVTLSHRWGDSICNKLLSSNIKDMESEIPASALTRTFHDAIDFTRRLNIRYLWIDALCIIQDSKKDWQQESALMHKVYQNSYCNLSGTHGNDGCFVQREPEPLSYCQTNIRWRTKQSVGSNRLYHIYNTLLWETEVENAPLNLRGWVLQERLLAPRILHFGRKQLFWECNELDACEAFPVALPILSLKPASIRSRNIRLKSILLRCKEEVEIHRMSNNSDLPSQVCRLLWYEIITTYSKTSLTCKEDKLVALSGIAKEIGSIRQDDYLAGLWQQSLIFDLSWARSSLETENLSLSGRRYPQYVAPSWSWASLDACIKFSSQDNLKPLAKFVRGQIDPSGADITGQLRGGSITLCGYLTSLQFRLNYDITRYDIKIGKKDVWDAVGTPSLGLDGGKEAYPSYTGKPLYFFLLHSSCLSSSSQYSGLVLEHTEEKRGRYQRIGQCTIVFDSDFIDQVIGKKRTMTDWDFEEYDISNNKCTIKIV